MERRGEVVDDKSILRNIEQQLRVIGGSLDPSTLQQTSKRSDSPETKKSQGRTISSALASRPNLEKQTKAERHELFDRGLIVIENR
jgi:hypothetical protein